MKNSLQCLLVDDDEDDREIFCLALELVDPSHHCLAADSALSALDQINTEHTFIPDFIFIDINMPGMNGLECLSQLRSIPRLSFVPIFVYSTTADPSTIAESLQRGATDYIIKPPSIPQLADILLRLISSQNIRTA